MKNLSIPTLPEPLRALRSDQQEPMPHARTRAQRLATAIIQARTDAQLTQHELAANAFVSRSSIAQYESGRSVPPFDVMERLAAAMGRSILFFTEGKDPARAAIEKLVEVLA